MNHYSTDRITPLGISPPGQAFPSARPDFTSLFNSEPWQNVIAESYGLQVESMTVASPSLGRQSLSFCDIDDVRGRRIISMPFCDYCDPDVHSLENWSHLASKLIAREAPLRFKVVRNQVPLGDQRFSAVEKELWHGTELTLPETMIWARIDPAARRNIRKAEGAGIRVRIGSSLGDVMSFHDLHAALRRAKYRMLAQPRTFFESLHGHFSRADNLFVVLAELDGVPVAGILLLRWNDCIYYKFNASTHLELRPNDLLVWSSIKLGQELGSKLLDFGISAIDQPGLVAFKRKFASEERRVTQLSWSPDGYHHAQAAKVGAMLGGLTSILTADDVPTHVGHRASELLYRYFC